MPMVILETACGAVREIDIDHATHEVIVPIFPPPIGHADTLRFYEPPEARREREARAIRRRTFRFHGEQCGVRVYREVLEP